jgi:hypothetical protein
VISGILVIKKTKVKKNRLMKNGDSNSLKIYLSIMLKAFIVRKNISYRRNSQDFKEQFKLDTSASGRLIALWEISYRQISSGDKLDIFIV